MRRMTHIKNPHAVSLGRLAGVKNKAKGSEYFRALARKSNAKQHGKVYEEAPLDNNTTARV